MYLLVKDSFQITIQSRWDINKYCPEGLSVRKSDSFSKVLFPFKANKILLEHLNIIGRHVSLRGACLVHVHAHLDPSQAIVVWMETGCEYLSLFLPPHSDIALI